MVADGEREYGVGEDVGQMNRSHGKRVFGRAVMENF